MKKFSTCVVIFFGLLFLQSCGTVSSPKNKPRENFSKQDILLALDELPDGWYCSAPGCGGHDDEYGRCEMPDFLGVLRKYSLLKEMEKQ